MDYKPLIDAAMKRNGFTTRYQLAKALKYKNISTIYQVETGKRGLRPERLMKLLQLAGKTLAVAVIATTALLPQKSEASVSAQVYEKTSLFIHYTKRDIRQKHSAQKENQTALCGNSWKRSFWRNPCLARNLLLGGKRGGYIAGFVASSPLCGANPS